MTMLEIYKGRKEALTARIRESKSLYETGSVITEMLDTMKYQYLAAEPGTNREELGEILHIVTATLPLIESVNKAKLWEKSEEVDRLNAKKKSALPGLIAVLVGVGCIVLPTLYSVFTKKVAFADVLTGLEISLVGCLVLLLAGFMLFHRKKVKRNTTVEISVDAEDIADRLEGIIKEVDDVLAMRKKRTEETARANAVSLSEDEVKLFAYLMEAKYSGDGEYMAEQLADVETYLSKLNILLVDYKVGAEKYFEFLDGDETKTIRPALLRDGRVLSMGLAQIKVD